MPDPNHQNEEITRKFAQLVAICGLCIGALCTVDFFTRTAPQPWWISTGYPLVIVALAGIAGGAQKLPYQTLRAIIIATVLLGFTLQLSSYGSSASGVETERWELAWMLSGVYLSFITLTITTRHPHLTINLIAAVTATFPALSHFYAYGTVTTYMVQVTLVQFTNVGFPMLLIELRSRMSDYGRRQSRWKRRVTEASAVREQLIEERRLSGVLHDNVLGIMSQIVWSGGTITDDLRTSASSVTTLLENNDRLNAPELNGNELRTLITSALHDAEPDLSIVFLSSQGTIPENVTAVIIPATLEAVRNSTKHAPQSDKELRINLTQQSLTVQVLDTGPGFSLQEIPHNRLGVTQSILRRMKDLPGGNATISSSIHAGTVVTLTWERE